MANNSIGWEIKTLGTINKDLGHEGVSELFICLYIEICHSHTITQIIPLYPFQRRHGNTFKANVDIILGSV